MDEKVTSLVRRTGDSEPAEDGYCPSCGHYIPRTLAGERSAHDCPRTAPLDGLPTGLCVCPVCAGYGLRRWGCRGSKTRPHPHAYMRPVHEVVGVDAAVT